jgi:copper(I)-binding protein
MKPAFPFPSSLSLSLAAVVLNLACGGAYAQVAVKDAWVRATVPAQKSTGAFMQLTAARDLRLIEARSPAAGAVEIHEMRMENNVMKMNAVEGIALPAGKTVNLASGSYHVMMMDLKAQVKEGDTVPLTLVVEDKDKKRQNIEVKAVARALGAPAKGGMHDGHGEHKH